MTFPIFFWACIRKNWKKTSAVCLSTAWKFSAELLEKISEVLHVSPSSLFYSPEEKSLDESDWSKIEEIITEEAEKTVVSAKVRISELHHFFINKAKS